MLSSVSPFCLVRMTEVRRSLTIWIRQPVLFVRRPVDPRQPLRDAPQPVSVSKGVWRLAWETPGEGNLWAESGRGRAAAVSALRRVKRHATLPQQRVEIALAGCDVSNGSQQFIGT
jgi:hypothetical protein